MKDVLQARNMKSGKFSRLGNEYKLQLSHWYTSNNESIIIAVPIGYICDIEKQSLSQALFSIREINGDYNVYFYGFKDYSKYLNPDGSKIEIQKENRKKDKLFETVESYFISQSQFYDEKNKVLIKVGDRVKRFKRVPIVYNPFDYIPASSSKLKKLRNLDAVCSWINRFRYMADREQDEFIQRHNVVFGERSQNLKVVNVQHYGLFRDVNGVQMPLRQGADFQLLHDLKSGLSKLNGLYIRETTSRTYITDEKELRHLREQGVKMTINPTIAHGSQTEKHYQNKNKRNTRPNIRDTPYIGSTLIMKHTVSKKDFVAKVWELSQKGKESLRDYYNSINENSILVWDKSLALKYIDSKLE